MFIDNKYNKWYFSIVKHAQARQNISYVEKHHIIPKSLGGNNQKLNIVCLTAREHFICHRLLTKMTEGKNKIKMLYAVWAMTTFKGKHKQRTYKILSRTYELLKTQIAQERSKNYKGKPWTKSRKIAQEQRKNKPSKSLGRKLTLEHRLNISNSRMGKLSPKTKIRSDKGTKRLPETGQKISAKKKGKKFTKEHIEAIKIGWIKRKQNKLLDIGNKL